MKSTRSFSWAHIELNAEITSSFSPVNSSRWLQGKKDPVHTWFKWQTSRKMLQLIRWKLCSVFLEKSRRCIYFLSKLTEFLDQKQAQSLWNRFTTIIMVSRFCEAVIKHDKTGNLLLELRFCGKMSLLINLYAEEWDVKNQRWKLFYQAYLM